MSLLILLGESKMLFNKKINNVIEKRNVDKNKVKKPKRKLSIRSKYLVTLLMFTLLSIITVAYIAWYNAKESLTKSSYDQLITLRNIRVQDIQNFFSDNASHLKILSENDTVINAMKDFDVAYDFLKLYEKSVDNKQRKQIDAFYENEFYPKLKPSDGVLTNIHQRIALNKTSSYLQYHYIVNNDNKNKKDRLMRASDSSYYSEIHNSYHQRLRLISGELNLRDLFLINKDSGDIVYSVAKNVDFSTNLLNGPYVDSGLAKAVRILMKAPDRKMIIIQDIQPYIPAYNEPTAFMLVPIYNKNTYTGILGVRISMSIINSIMTHDKQWVNDGLGRSGEVYLLGSDLLMRSDSRFLIENKMKFLNILKEKGENSKVLKNIDIFNTTVFNKLVNTQSAQAALRGEVGDKIINNYYGLNVLSTYAPVKVSGLNWIVLAEKSLEEVRQPIVNLQRVIMISTIILIVFVSVFSLIYSSFFLQPIYRMIHSAKKFIDRGELSQVKINSSDEIGTLTYYFNKLINHSQSQYDALKQENQQRHQLMLSFFPKNIVERMERGESNIARKHDNIALLFVSFRGLNELINDNKKNKGLKELSKLFNTFDSLARDYEVDKLTLFGDNYVATCGLHKPRIDYARRCVNFSLELFDLIQRFNQEKNVNLRLRIGIHSGSMVEGIVGKEHFTYGLWGETISIADRIRYDASFNTLRITQNVYDQLTIKQYFERGPLLHLDALGQVETWEYNADTYAKFSLSTTQSKNNTDKVTEKVIEDV